MTTRTLAMIYRDTNRLKDTIDEYAPKYAALAALKPGADAHAAQVDAAYKAYVDSLAKGAKERSERETSLDALRSGVSKWRGVALAVVPGAEATVHALPPRGGTPDDMLRVGDVLVHFIETNPGAAAFRKEPPAERPARKTPGAPASAPAAPVSYCPPAGRSITSHGSFRRDLRGRTRIVQSRRMTLVARARRGHRLQQRHAPFQRNQHSRQRELPRLQHDLHRREHDLPSREHDVPTLQHEVDRLQHEVDRLQHDRPRQNRKVDRRSRRVDRRSRRVNRRSRRVNRR